ncbi:PSD1 and planctomycete cytochrome C domain-containing protein [uncultured Gimesia sp.]|mgnify:CR=1 FL=1|uniref:PSD1 and planctomycete cytochrome C domain-containing protein n=1 Tax=uncultured Gimesia sp. TaxID=1678688 RepID=UPI0026244E78|nr:PSD1 and planctomycete cytochrome C domain-containing protein [uncultured Gimesia sp.]
MKHILRIISVFLLLIGFVCFSTSAEEAKSKTDSVPQFAPEQLEFFEKSIRPLLAEHCYECHSGQSKRLEGGLRLDSRALLLKGGDTGPSADLKKTHESLLLQAVRYESFEMPPNTRLKKEQIDLLARWVEMGLPWPEEKPPAKGGAADTFDLKKRQQEHWAWQPMKEVPPPAVKNKSWSTHPVDQFILAKLEEKQLQPTLHADKRTIIRRLYFDLIGVPPTAAQIHSYLSDTSPNATEKVVDQLLAAPQFGERWARHWLDLMRYAESRGHEFDNDAPNAYQYRDYVIRALNADLPYDQFVTEHIAGDLLQQPRLNPEQQFNESVLATAFWYLSEWVHSPVDIRKDETDRFDNAIDVMTKSFLGMTVSCARCHDHKFDAISTKDYYALYGYLQSSNYHQVRFESMAHNQKIAQQTELLHKLKQTVLKTKLKSTFAAGVNHFAEYFQAAKTIAQQFPDEKSPELDAEIKQQAAARKLNPAILKNWVQFTQSNQDQENRFFASLQKETETAVSLEPVNSQATGNTDSSETTIINYANCAPADFIADGFSFGLAPRARGTLVFDQANQQIPLTVLAEGAARRDFLWEDLVDVNSPQMNQKNQLRTFPRSGRTLRTPTFEVQGAVSYKIKGGCWVYACVDSHRMLFGPLHGSTLKKIPATPENQPRWVTHDLSRYKGHRIHLEFTVLEKEPLEVYQVKHGTPQSEQPLTSISLKNEKKQQAAETIQSQSLKGQQTVQHAVQEYFNAEQTPSAETVAVINWMIAHPDLFSDPQSRERLALTQEIEHYRAQCEQLKQTIQTKSQTAMAIMDGSAESDHVLIRGSHQNPGPLVERRFLEALNGKSPALTPGSGRLELAKAINDRSNPLTHRVIVNRIWAHLFGRGIVPSVDNLGVLGERPSHPELLDYLALQFLKQGRSLKQMIKTIVLTQTYQQASQTTLNVSEIDPDNIYLYKMPLKRLEGEAIRDALLSISGRIDSKMYGPSVPVHLTRFMDGRGKPPVNGPLDGDGRRSIYIQVRRNFLSPMMLAYDTPSPFSTMGRPNVSNVPAQALIMMNDPFVLQQAQLWGKRVTTDSNRQTTDDRIRWMYESALSRLPSPEELTAARQFILEGNQQNPPTADPALIWAELGHVIFNLKEFIYVF